MSLVTETTRCPYCREKIAVGAIRCKHCHTDLKEKKTAKPSPFARYNTFRYGFWSGIIFCIITGLLLYFQIYR